jgi:hypothetical protein
VSAAGAICTGTNHLEYNFTGAAVNYAFTTTAGSYLINVTDSGTSTTHQATITVSASGSNPLDLLVIGNNDTIALTVPTTGTVVHLEVYGNYDTTTITPTGAGATERVNLYEVGLHDTTTLAKASGLTFVASIWGTTDTVAGPTTANSNGGTTVRVYYSGFLPGPPASAACPTAGYAAASDTVSGSSTEGTYQAEWNVTSSFTPTAVTDWTLTSQIVSQTAQACPFFSQSQIPFDLAQASAGLDVHFANTYIPPGDVAFDQGAVIYAQDGGVPTMVDGPSITATENGQTINSLSLWFPVFVGQLPTESGLSTTSVAARLVSVTSISLTSANILGIANSTNIVITIHSPYTAAWEGWLDATPGFAGHFVCTPATGAACIGPYTSSAPMGTIVLTVPTTTQLDKLSIQIATFSISLV